VLDELLKGPEGGPPGDKEPSLVQLPYSVVFDCVSVPDRQRVIVSSGFRVPYQKGPVLILR